MLNHLDYPSSSMMNRLFVCPVSFWRCKRLPETTSAEAERGSKIHAVLSRQKDEKELSEDEYFIYKKMKNNLDRFISDFDLSNYEIMYQEDRLYYFDEIDGKPLYSGKPDLILKLADKRYAVIEFKTGKSNYPLPPFNWQLNSQAILISDCENGYQVIVNPDTYHSYCFTKKDVDDWQLQIAQRMRVILNNSDECPAVPSIECKYCKANTYCPQFQNYCVPAAINNKHLDKEIVANIILDNVGKQLNNNPQIAYQTIKKIKFVADAFTIIKNRLKELLEKEPNAFNGLIRLGDNRKTIDVNCKPEDIFMKYPQYIEYNDYAQCVKLDLNKFILVLQNKIREKNGEKPVKTLNKEFKETIIAELEKEGYITVRNGEREFIIE